jgi:hypothetical protein
MGEPVANALLQRSRVEALRAAEGLIAAGDEAREGPVVQRNGLAGVTHAVIRETRARSSHRLGVWD